MCISPQRGHSDSAVTLSACYTNALESPEWSFIKASLDGWSDGHDKAHFRKSVGANPNGPQLWFSRAWPNPEMMSTLFRKWWAACPSCDSLLLSFSSSGLLIECEHKKLRFVIIGVQTLYTGVKWAACICRLKASDQDGPKGTTSPPLEACHKLVVSWRNEHGNTWTFWMLWKSKWLGGIINCFWEKTAAKITRHWSHLIWFATLGIMLRTTLFHSLPESIEMPVEMGTISLLSMMSAKRSDSKVTNVHKTQFS